MLIYNNVAELTNAKLVVGDLIQLIGENVVGDRAPMVGLVRPQGFFSSNRLITISGGLVVEIMPELIIQSSDVSDSESISTGGVVRRKIKDILSDFPDIRMFGAVSDGITNDNNSLEVALSLGKPFTISKKTKLELTTAQAELFLEKINLIHFLVPTEVVIESGEVNFQNRVYIENPTTHNLSITGQSIKKYSITGCSVLGSDVNYTTQIFVTDSTGISSGQYILVNGVSGTGLFKSIVGCWKVVGVSENVVTVKTPFQGVKPVFTITNGDLYLVPTVLRWVSNVVGLAITSYVKSISNLILSGSYDVSSEPLADGACDGLQIGTSPNTPETSLNESEQGNFGVVYLANVGITEWKNNGTQVFGRLYATNSHICSCGWRGWQAGRGGSITAKSSSGSANGASGYETEEGAFLLAHNSSAIGNKQQGVFSIGGASTVDVTSSQIGYNVTFGLDARNFATILADGSIVSNNTLGDLNSTSGNILFGSQASCTGKSTATEGGVINGFGATSIGIPIANKYDGSRIIQPNATSVNGETVYWQRTDGVGVRSSVTSAGDLSYVFPGSTLTFKSGGDIYFKDGSSLGRKENSISSLVMKTSGGKYFQLSINEDGTIRTVVIP